MINKIKKLVSSFFIDTEFVSTLNEDLNKKVIIITGASKGIGKAIAQVLDKDGAKLVLVSRHKNELEKVIPASKSVLCIEGDITKQEDIDNIVKETVAKHGKIDVLINNAGMFLDKNIEEVTEKEFQSIMDTNIKSIFLFCKSLIPIMKQQKSGLIINIGSKISHNTQVTPKKVLYATTKYAVEGFSYALGKELKSYGIRVTCLMPGTVNTFVSLKSKDYMSPFSLGLLVSTIIKCKDVDFESIIFKSVSQNI